MKGQGFNPLEAGGMENIELLERYFENEKNLSLDPSWKSASQSLNPKDSSKALKPSLAKEGGLDSSREEKILRLIQAFRNYGHLAVNINPLSLESKSLPLQIEERLNEFSEKEDTALFPTYGLLKASHAPFKEIKERLYDIYCGKIGIEYTGSQNEELIDWLQNELETPELDLSLPIETKRIILDKLNHSELFEKFLHTKYVGQKRFSIEGGETLIPMMSLLVESAADYEVEEIAIGMAHRGRLNILCNILNKSYSEIFNEFEDRFVPNSFEGSGDVKYHKGFTATVTTTKNKKVIIDLTPNPSHLEAVCPVVTGLVRCKQDILKGKGVKEPQKKIIPVFIHGDAAIAGQGVVYETLQMYNLGGYKTGGTLHIVVNNQIGFTTLPQDGRSTTYATDIAKGFGAPVFHVNAEDPESCVLSVILALKIRQKFGIDVFIDLNCYRKYGHNEADEPAYTQPLEYQMIREKKGSRELYRDELIRHGFLEKEVALELEKEFQKALQEELELSKKQNPFKAESRLKQQEDQFKDSRSAMLKPIKTGVDEKVLKSLASKLTELPSDFKIHPKLKSLFKDRADSVLQHKEIDWGTGEYLALGSLLIEGVTIRLAGQDSGRGTFSHRHALLIDQEKGKPYIPLDNLEKEQGRLYLYNSFLSEYGALGFEYGYSIAKLDNLVIWEAQFGDFVNGAQVIIDQFLSSSEQKWGQRCNLVLFLPHGYEGQGPEHSSARMERFLNLSAENNQFVIYPTTPAQLFHMLRRHMLRNFPKPLIVFTPKGLLRHPQAVSSLQDFNKGSFEEVIDDPLAEENAEDLVFCSGRIYYDLLEEKKKREKTSMAICRIEQLYPLNVEKLEALIQKYKSVKRYSWVQEEPCNMGAFEYIQPRLESLLPEGIKINYYGRKRSASTATGSTTLHRLQLEEILGNLFSDSKPTIFDVAAKGAEKEKILREGRS
ncbi:2-oxoglutarate dehydrogenase E1 component [Criblamydia sequanensis]|uniref:oxoglutarate dehydrogenase (succinyl-transferring) n=1 Tax=Candidatus Criblamydia sequanensis CRIB-18 TaxID=1437425 RepID=A0A090D255_9BACT|nr:2-oxoglutarate dehydrogenase E1 component [Criblamydia sequanensis]CDR34073.1 2-oxoglutarate dehydrogenase E1 component [Criblamydia sequanensis CRIB-18]